MGRLLMDAELIDRCLDNYCKSGLTKKSYRVDLMKIKKHIEEKNISLDELKHEDIRGFFNEYEKKYATESVNRCKNALTFFFNYLILNDYLDVKSEKIINSLERKIPDNKQEKYLNKNEIETLLNFIKNAPRQRGEQVKSFEFLRARDLFMLSLCIFRGLRATETSRLTMECFNIENKRINIDGSIRKNGGTKYHKNLDVILDQNLIDLYEKYIVERNKLPNLNNDYVFLKPNGNTLFTYKSGEFVAGGILTSILRKRIKQFNMYNMIHNPTTKPIDPTLSIHCLRHTAVYYLQSKLTLPEISYTLGQKSLKSVNRYSHNNEQDIEDKLNSI